MIAHMSGLVAVENDEDVTFECTPEQFDLVYKPKGFRLKQPSAPSRAGTATTSKE